MADTGRLVTLAAVAVLACVVTHLCWGYAHARSPSPSMEGAHHLSTRERGRGIDELRREAEARRAKLKERQAAVAAYKATGVLPIDKELLESVPGLAPRLKACEWIVYEGDLFRGRCDLAAIEGADCASACDDTEDGKCKAWTRVDTSCFLKSCSDIGPADFAARGAISGVRANETRCAALRGWTRYVEPEWMRRWRDVYGSPTFATHKRKPTDATTFAPLVTVRGERHSGTNWVRAMVDKNCGVGHRLAPSLDSDGVYGWKHGFVPDNWSPDTLDAMVVLVRSAASWVPKMKRSAYNQDLDRRGKTARSLADYMRIAFVDNYGQRQFASVVDLRTAKYVNYRETARRCPKNVFAVRYEDLVTHGAAFLFEALGTHLPACSAHPFVPIDTYTKFGASSSTQHVEHVPNWSQQDWDALVQKLDVALETQLGYDYSANPGDVETRRPPPQEDSWLTLIP